MEKNNVYFVVKVVKGYNEGGIPKSLDSHDVFETYTTAQEYMKRYAYGDDVHDYQILSCEPKDMRYLHVIKKEDLPTIIDECCPFCESEVELPATFEPHKCPVCGKWIAPCNLCDHDVCDCKNCPLTAICHRRNVLEFGENYDNINYHTDDMEIPTPTITETVNESKNPLCTRLVNYFNKMFDAIINGTERTDANILYDVVRGNTMNAFVRNNANNALSALKKFIEVRDDYRASAFVKKVAETCIVRFLACLSLIDRKARFTNVMPQGTYYIDENCLLQVGEYDSNKQSIVAYYDGNNDMEFDFSTRTLKEEFVNEIAIDTNFVRLELQEVITDELMRYLDPVQAETEKVKQYLNLK